MFETIELFGEKVDIKNNCCVKKGKKPQKAYMKLNLYIKLTDMCNANCSVCSNRGNEKASSLDYNKLKFVIETLDKKNLMQIKDLLLDFEDRHRNLQSAKGKRLIKKEYVNSRILK